jgi:glycosyltransferase involved in cell wall biosynthesis
VSSGAGTVILYRGHSDYDSVATMVEDLGAALRRRGFATAMLDVRAPDCIAESVRLVRAGDVRFFLSVNGYGIPAAGQGAGFYGETRAPMLIYFVDHPAYHYPTIRTKLPRLAATFPTAHHVDFCAAHIRRDIALRHVPHAAAPSAIAPPAWATRDLPLLLSASLHGEPETIRAGWRQHGEAVERSLNAIVEAHDAAPTEPLDHMIASVIGRDDLPIEVLASYFLAADTYLRSRAKRDLVAALARLPLTVCGKGWEKMAESMARSRVRFLPAQPAPESMALMRRAKLVLNPLPAYYESHERPFQAMAAGAVAATGPSALFGGAEFAGALLSLPSDPRDAAARIEAALADDDALQAMAEAGTRVQAAGHRWDDRAAALAELAQAVSAT